jgi:hypothetical protein
MAFEKSSLEGAAGCCSVSQPIKDVLKSITRGMKSFRMIFVLKNTP